MAEAVIDILLALKEFFSSDAFAVIVLVLLSALALYAIFRAAIRLRAKLIGRLLYTRAFSEEGLHAGESCFLVEEITNPTPFPLFGINVGFYINEGLEIDGVSPPVKEKIQYFESRFAIMPRRKVTRTHVVVAKKRGLFEVNGAEVYADGRYIYFETSAKLYVYPSPISNFATLPPQTDVIGEFISRSRAVKDPFVISGMREYRVGDPFGSINFKASARAIRAGVRELTVNEHESTSRFEMMVYFDIHRPNYTGLSLSAQEYAFENGLSYVTSMITNAFAAGGRIGFAADTPDGRNKFVIFPPDGGRAHMTDILKFLAVMSRAPGVSLSTLLDCETARGDEALDICIIAFSLDDETEKRVRLLRACGRSVSVILLERESL